MPKGLFRLLTPSRFLFAVAAISVGFASELPPPVYFRVDHGVASGSAPVDLDSTNALRWQVEIGPGHSTPLAWGDKLFLTSCQAETHQLATLALDNTGRELWRRVAPATRLETYHRATGSPAAATPACDGERLYVFFGSYGLICYDLDGRTLWDYPMGPFQDEFGAASSPIIVGSNVILNEDHDVDSFLIAIDRQTGRVAWRSRRPDAVRSYSTPTVWERKTGRELLVAGALELAAYDPASGEKLWWVNGLARIVIPVPAPEGDMVFTACWTPGGDQTSRLSLDPWPKALAKWDRNHDGKLARSEIDNADVLDRFFRMDLDQSGDLDEREWDRHADVFRRAQNAALGLRPSGRGDLTQKAIVWKHLRGAPYVPSPLVHNGLFWMVKDGGIVTKLDAATGKVLQEERLPGLGNYYASPITAAGKVYFAGELGRVTVLAEERDWRVLATHDFHEKIYATPVIRDGRLYIRTEKALYCFGSQDATPVRPSPASEPRQATSGSQMRVKPGGEQTDIPEHR